jgi:DNA-binding MarR family transcriptional regulator
MHEFDALRNLGLLSLGSRFRRLGERLQADTQVMLNGLDPRIAAGWHPVLDVLDREGPQSVGQLTSALGITQPGVTRMVAALVKIGVVEVTAGVADARVRMVSLTRAGQALVVEARAGAWPAVAAAVADLCDDFGEALLEQLARIEDRLDERPLHRRPGDTP